MSRPGLEVSIFDSLKNILRGRLYLSAFIASQIRKVLQEKQQIYIPPEMLDFYNLFRFTGFSITLLLVNYTPEEAGEQKLSFENAGYNLQ